MKDLLLKLSQHPVAIWEPGLEALLAVYQHEVAPTTSAISAAVHSNRERSIAKRSGAVSVVPIRGVITARKSIWEAYGLATSVESIVSNVREAVDDPDVKAVVMDIDSPGGTVSGVPEAHAELMAMRGKKPIVAHADHLAASAAYYLASAADEIVASPSALVGSVGVYIMHADFSQALEADGVKVTFVKAGEDKAIANSYEPLDEKGTEYLQGLVDDAYKAFTGDVAKARGISVSDVIANYGKGRVLTAKEALSAGAVDKIRTSAEVLGAYGITESGRKAFRREHRALDALEHPQLYGQTKE